jgi:hypothetical protein
MALTVTPVPLDQCTGQVVGAKGLPGTPGVAALLATGSLSQRTSRGREWVVAEDRVMEGGAAAGVGAGGHSHTDSAQGPQHQGPSCQAMRSRAGELGLLLLGTIV